MGVLQLLHTTRMRVLGVEVSSSNSGNFFRHFFYTFLSHNNKVSQSQLFGCSCKSIAIESIKGMKISLYTHQVIPILIYPVAMTKAIQLS